MNEEGAGQQREAPPAALPVFEDPLHGKATTGDEVAQSTRPKGAPRYASWKRVWLPIPLILLLLDVGFDGVFWRIPKLTGTAADYTYQFLYDLHHLQRRPSGWRVLVFGSSVAGGFDPFQVEALLSARLPGTELEVRRLLRPGMKPSDYRLLFDAEAETLHADVAVGVFNLVDFLNPSVERNLKPGIRNVLPPWETLRARYDYIPDLSEKLELAFAGVSRLVRYRKPIRSALRDHARALWLWSRGGGGAAYGWYRDGYAKQFSGVPIRAGEPRELEVYVDPAWIEQRGRVRLEVVMEGRQLSAHVFVKAGWQRIALGIGASAEGVAHLRADSAWSPRAAGRGDDPRLLGVRVRELPEGAGDANGARPPFRYPPVEASEVKPFLRMGEARGEEYARRWRQTLEGSSDFAKRFRIYRDEKLALRDVRFRPVEEYEELRLMVEELARRGVRVVLINTPENPLLSDLLQSAYYRDYLSFFRDLAARDDRVVFYDLHNALPLEDLNDLHHVNFVGQIKLGQRLADWLEREARSVASGRAGLH